MSVMAATRSVVPTAAAAQPRDPGLPTSARPPSRDNHPPFTAGVRLRRRPAVIGLGIALIVLGSLGAAWLVTTLAGAAGVVVAARDIPAGQVITAEDLRVADIGGTTTGTAYIPAGALDDAIGRRTTVPLLTGQVVPPQAITGARLVPTGPPRPSSACR